MPVKNSSPAKRRKTTVSKLKPLSLLVLECDARKLQSQSLSFAQEIHTIIKHLPKKLTVEVGLINSEDDFRKILITCTEKYSSIKNIVVIGHSNRNLICVAPSFNLEWKVFARWLLSFRPQKIALIACEAGQFHSTRALFDEIPKLTKIYASPFKSTKLQFMAIHLLLAYLLLTTKQEKDLIYAAQVANFWKTGGVILECSRRNPEGNQILQFLGSILGKIN
jgi:hypothetical protein